MQNGYRYTSSARPDGKQNTASGQADNAQPRKAQVQNGAPASRQNARRTPGQASGTSTRQIPTQGANAAQSPRVSPQNANRGQANSPGTAQNARVSPRSANTPDSAQTRAAVTPGGSGEQTRAVGERAGTGVAVPANGKGGVLGFWKKVFALTPVEAKHNAVVPRVVEGYDYVFLIIVLVLLAFGSVMVYSASYAYAKTRYGDSYYYVTKQAIFMTVGFVGMFIAARFPPDFYKRFAPHIYIGCFLLLCLVPIPGIGVVSKGARRWVGIAGLQFQPSEMMKFGLAAMLAWYFDRYQKRVVDYTNFWKASAFGVFFPYMIVGVTCVMIIIEKHLSGTIIMFLIGTIIIFAGGAMKRWLAALGGVGMVALLVLGLFTDYTKRRFDLWLHPEKYPLDGGWQTLQGLYAIGSGGFFGVGIGESRMKHMYVSEPQNDFIFTIVCEELGFIGAVAVIALFMLFIYRGMVIAMRAPDIFSQLLVTGIIGKVAIQAVLNIAVVTASIPNTGIALPFFSYGGTSLCVLMAEMGVVLSISRYSKQRK